MDFPGGFFWALFSCIHGALRKGPPFHGSRSSRECINFGGFWRAFSWRIFLGTSSPRNRSLRRIKDPLGGSLRGLSE